MRAYLYELASIKHLNSVFAIQKEELLDGKLHFPCLY